MNGVTVTTAIPYVNAAPHLGHALQLVQADVLARHPWRVLNNSARGERRRAVGPSCSARS